MRRAVTPRVKNIITKSDTNITDNRTRKTSIAGVRVGAGTKPSETPGLTRNSLEDFPS